MTVSIHKNLFRAMVLVVCLELAGCVPDGGVTPRVLEGEWQLDRFNGTVINTAFTWEFEEDGDFRWCYSGDCYDGEWEWNSDKTEIDIQFVDGFGDLYNTEFEVEILDNEKLKGEWSFEGEIYQMEFDRN